MNVSEPTYQWYTPCGQLLAARIEENGSLTAELHDHSGEVRNVSPLAMAHLNQWHKAEMAHLELTEGANQRLNYVQSNMETTDEAHREHLRAGLSAYYDEMHRMRMNAANMKQIREVSLQRALVAADKDMMAERKPAHGHYAPVVSLGREVARSKIDY